VASVFGQKPRKSQKNGRQRRPKLEELTIMQAAVFHDKDRIEVQEVATPTLEAGEVLLEVDVCTVCGTDLRIYHHGHKNVVAPRVLGHEFCGRVVESRAPDANVQIGDRVVMYIVLPCHECRYCLAGRPNLCVSRTTMGYHHDGAFAKYVKIPAQAVANGHLFPLPLESEIPSSYMALAEPLGCVINAHGPERLNIGLKDTVVVIGAGPIGVMHALVSRLQGAQKVWMLDTNARRLEQAAAFDIDGTMLVEKDGGHREKLLDLTDGFGPSVVIVAASSPHAQSDALEIAGRGGRVEFFGGLPKGQPNATLNTNHIHYKELVVSGSYSEKMSDFQASQALIQSGRFPADKIITHSLPLERINESWGLMESGEALKVAIEPR